MRGCGNLGFWLKLLWFKLAKRRIVAVVAPRLRGRN